ncbi:MAG: hypothetical protein IT561_13180, partial [Alphaproteobacteria bacterium]|nr:hypothetical protein [Alphaproteobacteria bacterium]
MAMPPFVSPIDALRRIPAGARVFISPSCGEPLSLTHALGTSWHELPPLHLLFSMQVNDYPFLAGLGRGITAETWGVQPPIRARVADGGIDFVPIRYSRVPGELQPGGRFSPDVALVQVSPPDAQGNCSLGAAVGLSRDVVPRAALVIAEINPLVPRTMGDSLVRIEDLDILVEGHLPPVPFVIPAPTETEHAIARHVAGLVPDGATIQVGIGGIPDAVAGALRGKNDLGVHSGMISDSLAGLIDAGVVTNRYKPIDRGASVTGELMGSAALFPWAHENPAIGMRTTAYTHRFDTLSRIPNLVCVNSAVEVDLGGQVNAESIGGMQVSAVGGQFDFVEAAMHGSTGRSILALPS